MRKPKVALLCMGPIHTNTTSWCKTRWDNGVTDTLTSQCLPKGGGGAGLRWEKEGKWKEETTKGSRSFKSESWHFPMQHGAVANKIRLFFQQDITSRWCPHPCRVRWATRVGLVAKWEGRVWPAVRCHPTSPSTTPSIHKEVCVQRTLMFVFVCDFEHLILCFFVSL